MTTFRVICTLIWGALCGLWVAVYHPVATIGLGKVAGSQFDANDLAYATTQTAFAVYRMVNFITLAVFLGVLLLIWFRPLRKAIAALWPVFFIFVLMPLAGQ